MSQRRTFVNVPAAVLFAAQRAAAVPVRQWAVAVTTGTNDRAGGVEGLKQSRDPTATIAPRERDME